MKVTFVCPECLSESKLRISQKDISSGYLDETICSECGSDLSSAVEEYIESCKYYNLNGFDAEFEKERQKSYDDAFLSEFD